MLNRSILPHLLIIKKAVRTVYDNHQFKTVSAKLIITFLSLILKLNTFIFNYVHYLQVIRCAMGTNMCYIILKYIYGNISRNLFLIKNKHYYIYDT